MKSPDVSPTDERQFEERQARHVGRLTNPHQSAKNQSLKRKRHTPELKKQALAMFRAGETVSAVAVFLAVPRTTISGWFQVWSKKSEITGLCGRPSLLPQFNENEILIRIKGMGTPPTWKQASETIREQSGEKLSRRSVFRYLARWRKDGRLQ